MSRLEQFLTVAMAKKFLPVIGPGNLTHAILAFHDDRKLIGFVLAAERLMTNRECKKAGESEGLVIAGGFQMAAEGFRAHVDAEDRLGLRANR